MSVVQCVVGTDDNGVRLDRWFRRHYPMLTHGQLEKLLRTGQVRLDGGRVRAGQRLDAGQTIRVPPLPVPATGQHQAKEHPPVSPQNARMLQERVLFIDDTVIVIDKPAGLAVQGGSGIATHLDGMLDALRLGADERPRLVHRLDKETSGVMILARSGQSARRLTAAFRERDVLKIYWALTVGVPERHQGRIDLPLGQSGRADADRMSPDPQGGLPAITDYQVIEHAHRRAAFVALWPRTGRTHQLRAHLLAIGAPILGDERYGKATLPGTPLGGGLHLHARRLVVAHPNGGDPIDVTAPLPAHMRRAWAYFDFPVEPADDNPFRNAP